MCPSKWIFINQMRNVFVLKSEMLQVCKYILSLSLSLLFMHKYCFSLFQEQIFSHDLSLHFYCLTLYRKAGFLSPMVSVLF